MEEIYQLSWSHYTAGIVVVDDKVIATAPCLKWAIGLPVQQVLGWKRLENVIKC